MVAERRPLPVVANVPRADVREVLERHRDAAASLAFLESLELAEGAERPPSSAVAVAGGIEAYVVLGEDVDLAKLRTVIEGRADKVGKALAGAEKKLQNEGFLKKADPELVEAERERVAELRLEKELLERNAAGL